MWWRRSSISTFSPSSFAQRSAIVRPNRPDPTMTRSAFNRQLLRWGRGEMSLSVSRSPIDSRAPVGDQCAVGGLAQQLRHKTISAADRNVAQVLPPGGESQITEPSLQSQLRAKQL